MAYFDQAQFDVRCEWGRGGVEQLAPSDVIIIVDVLSFTTSVEIAVSRGAIVYPYLWKDNSVIKYANERGAEVAGPRNSIEGRFSLSPSSLLTAPPSLRLVMSSPNGSSLAFAAMSTGTLVVAGSLRNTSAVALWARSAGQCISVVPAGERWPNGSLRPAIEDLIGAGAILKRLSGRRSPEANVAVSVFEGAAKQLFEQLSLSSSGRELIECGFQRDVELSAEFDASESVPVIAGDSFVRFE